MWHVETDFFALAVFMIMLMKEHALDREKRDIQGKAFYHAVIHLPGCFSG